MNQLLSITACACLTALAAAWPGASRAEPAVDLAAVLQAALGRTEAAPAAQRAVQRRQAELARAEAAFDWQLQARASVERRDVIVERNGFLTSDTDTETFFSSQLGARRQLRNGISIAPALRLTSGLDDADEAVGGLGSGIGLGLEMPLLRGAGRPAAVAAEEAAREQLRAAESELEFARQRELVAAATGYWDALAARAEEQAAQRLLELAERGATLVEALVRQGEADEGRLASWRSDAAKRRLELNVARQQVQLAGIALARQLGRPTHGEALPEVAGGLPAPAAPSAVDAAYLAGLVEQAYRQRPDLRALAQHRQAAEARLAVASDGTRPRLNLLLDADAVTLAYARSLGGAPEHAELAVAEVDVAELLAHE
ncbi:MAG TPA: TolC family protein, partial [Gammaproteobacteria bacterium]